MAVEVTIPRLGWGMEKGTFVEWRKRDGESVEEGEVLFVMEGDKATEEIESLGGGVLRVAAPAPAPGDEVIVGTVIGHLLAPGEKAPSVAPPAAAPPAVARAVPTQRPASTTPHAQRDGVFASPRARRVARELGVEWTSLRATGTSGRIAERDVRAAASRGGLAAGSGSIASLSVEVDARRLMNLADRVTASTGGEVSAARLTTALFVRLCAAVGGSLLSRRGVAVGVLLSGEGQDGLLVVEQADGTGALAVARQLGVTHGRTAGGGAVQADLVVFDAGALGADGYEPAAFAAAPPTAPLLVFGRARAPTGHMSVTVRFDEAAVGLRAASALLDRLREALEAPDLWLAR